MRFWLPIDVSSSGQANRPVAHLVRSLARAEPSRSDPVESTAGTFCTRRSYSRTIQPKTTSTP